MCVCVTLLPSRSQVWFIHEDIKCDATKHLMREREREEESVKDVMIRFIVKLTAWYSDTGAAPSNMSTA